MRRHLLALAGLFVMLCAAGVLILVIAALAAIHPALVLVVLIGGPLYWICWLAAGDVMEEEGE